MGCFSLQQSKAITVGEGGVVLTNSDEIATRAHLVRNIGRSDASYGHAILAPNLRMPNLSQALAWSAFRHFPSHVLHKQQTGDALSAALREVGGLEPLPADARITRRGHYYKVFKYHAEDFGGLSRAQFTAALHAEGVPGLGEGYSMPLYRNDCFRRGEIERILPPARLGPLPDYEALHLPVAERFCSEQQITMMHHVLLAPEAMVLRIADAVAKVKQHAFELVAAGA